MKALTTLPFAIILMTLFMSCQSGKNAKQILSRPNSRMEVMDKIANSSSMSIEMMDAMLNNRNGKRMTTQTQEAMVKVVKDYPAMMQMIKSDNTKTNNQNEVMLPGIQLTMMVN